MPNHLSKNIRLFLFVVLSICCLNLQKIKAQSGQFIQFWGGPQYVALLYYDGYQTDTINKIRSNINTYRWGGGFDYINNFSQNYGFQTGLYYSGEGQKYTGMVHNYYDTTSKVYTRYNSSVTMDYFRVPLMMRFNSILDEGDRVNLSIFLGVQLGYLFYVNSMTTPDAPDSVLNRYSKSATLRKLYNAFDFGLGAGAQFNVKFRDDLYGTAGIRFDRSLGNIENTSYVLPDNAPVEWMYPVSTKKELRMSHNDVIQLMPSKLISVNVYLGLSFRTKKGKPEKPHPVDDLQQAE